MCVDILNLFQLKYLNSTSQENLMTYIFVFDLKKSKNG